MELPNIPELYEDELLYSYLFRLAYANGFAEAKGFFTNSIFSDKTESFKLRSDSLEYMGFLLRDTDFHDYYTGVEVLMDHTVFPVYFPFMSRLKQCLLINAIFRKKSEFPNLVGQLTAGYVDEFHICPECMKEGEHLRRSHHIYGVKVCHKHHIPLVKIKNNKKAGYTPLEELTVVDIDEQVRYSRFVHDLMECGIDTELYVVKQAIKRKADKTEGLKEKFLETVKKLGLEKPEQLAARLYKEATVLRNIILGERFNILLICVYTLFDSVEEFKKELTVAEKHIIPDGYSVVDNRGSAIELRHDECGTVFTTSTFGLECGWLCPKCMEKNENQLFDRMVQMASNGRYSVEDEIRGWTEEMTFVDHRRGEVIRNTPYQILKMVPDEIKNGTNETSPFHEVADKVRSAGPFMLLTYDNNKADVEIRHDTCGHVFKCRIDVFFKDPRCPRCKDRWNRGLTEFVSDRTSGQYKLLGFLDDEAELLDQDALMVRHVGRKRLLKILAEKIFTEELPVRSFAEPDLSAYETMHAKVATYLFTHFKENEDIDITKQRIEGVEMERLKFIFMILKKREFLSSVRMGIYRLNISEESIKPVTAKSVIRDYIGKCHQVGDTFRLEELPDHEGVSHKAIVKALGDMRKAGELELVSQRAYRIIRLEL